MMMMMMSQVPNLFPNFQLFNEIISLEFRLAAAPEGVFSLPRRMHWELDFFGCFPWVVEESNLMGGIMVSTLNQSVVFVQLGNGYCIHQVVPRLAHLHIEWHDNRRFMKDQRMKWKTHKKPAFQLSITTKERILRR